MSPSSQQHVSSASSGATVYQDPGFNGTDVEKQRYAYKYTGYPKLSAWMASSKDAFVLRRFSAVNARTLLHLQDEIARKEKILEDFDTWTMKLPEKQGGCGSFRLDRGPEGSMGNLRDQTLRELRILLQQYYDLINAFTAVKQLPTATAHHIRNLRNWDRTFEGAIAADERHLFVERNVGDLFPIIPRSVAPLTRFLENWRWLRFLFRLKPRPGRDSAPNAIYTSTTGFERVVHIIVVVIGLGFLFGPMWWLNWVADNESRLAIITGFVAAFAGWLGLAASSPRGFEILAATAAYAAVLMVYLQVQQNDSKSS